YEEAAGFFRKAKEEKLTDANIRRDVDKTLDELSNSIRNNDLFKSRFNAGNFDELIKEYSKQLRSSSAEDFLKAELHFFLAKSYSAKGDNDNAIKEYAEAIRKDPNYKQALLNRAAINTIQAFS